jgi:hypothetical protein
VPTPAVERASFNAQSRPPSRALKHYRDTVAAQCEDTDRDNIVLCEANRFKADRAAGRIPK